MEISKALMATIVLLMATFALTQATLTSESAAEGSCLDPQSISDPTVWAFIFSYFNDWHIPMGSEYMYRKYAEILLGRSANNDTELREMNLKAKCATLICNLKGYTKNVRQVCSVNSVDPFNLALIHNYSCPSINIPLVQPSSAPDWDDLSGPDNVPPIISVIYSDDNNSTIALNLCINGTQRGFFVFSKSSTLSSEVNIEISNLLVDSGFDSSRFYYP